jgi:excinuclease ABC subunit B
VQIIADFRRGAFDALIGVNLLREGLDLPEVSLVAVLDADKEGFLRSETSLIQTAGRAARNVGGIAVFYADRVTDSMKRAIDETKRRRAIQRKYNEEHGIVPETIIKSVDSALLKMANLGYMEPFSPKERKAAKDARSLDQEIADLEREMKEAARELEFEKAAQLRDQLKELRAMKLFG